MSSAPLSSAPLSSAGQASREHEASSASLPPAASRLWFASGALLGLLAVASAAAAAHVPDRLLHAGGRDALRAAVQILGWHAAALLACALWLRETGLRMLVHAAAGCLLAGTFGFCIGVAVPVFGGPHLGHVAPTGGSLLMLGWLLLAASTLRRPRPRGGPTATLRLRE